MSKIILKPGWGLKITKFSFLDRARGCPLITISSKDPEAGLEDVLFEDFGTYANFYDWESDDWAQIEMGRDELVGRFRLVFSTFKNLGFWNPLEDESVVKKEIEEICWVAAPGFDITAEFLAELDEWIYNELFKHANEAETDEQADEITRINFEFSAESRDGMPGIYFRVSDLSDTGFSYADCAGIVQEFIDMKNRE